MLERVPKHLGCLVGGVLMATAICFLGYYVGVYQGDVHTAKTVESYTKAQNEDLREAIEQQEEAIGKYQAFLSRGLLITKSGTIFVKGGTIVIPPMPAPDEKEKL